MRAGYKTAFHLLLWGGSGLLLASWDGWKIAEDIGAIFTYIVVWIVWFGAIARCRMTDEEERRDLGSLPSKVETWERLRRDLRREQSVRRNG